MSEHTPGPWFWTGGLTVNASTGRRCYDELRSEHVGVLDDGLELRVEDAHLIAVAPDLLEALINMYDRAIGWTHRHMFGADEWAEITALIVKAGGTPAVCERGCQPGCLNYIDRSDVEPLSPEDEARNAAIAQAEGRFYISGNRAETDNDSGPEGETP